MIDLISNMLLLTASLGAMAYCHMLARKLRKLSQLDHGVGRSIATLSLQVDDLKSALDAAKAGTRSAQEELAESVKRAESARRHLELLVAAMQIPQKAKAGEPVTLPPRDASSSDSNKPMEPVRVPWKKAEPLKLAESDAIRPQRVKTNKRARRLLDMALTDGVA